VDEKEMLGKIHGEMGLLERIITYIPGYRGYKERELRRESDRLVRMEAVNRLRAAKDIIRRSLTNPTVAQRFFSEDAWRFDVLMSHLDRVTQRIDRAVAGYAGMFDAVRVREDKIDMATQHDLSLIEKAEAVRMSAESLARSEPSRDELRRAVDDLISKVKELDTLIDRRVEIFRGLTG
jgi:ribosomal protein L17